MQCTVQLYHQELPAMSFATNNGKKSKFVRNCTTSGQYCTLMMTKSGATPTDNQTVVGAITIRYCSQTLNLLKFHFLLLIELGSARQLHLILHVVTNMGGRVQN